VQGRVFALKQMATKAATLVAYITAGALADRVVDAAAEGGALLVAWAAGGVGPGRGIAAMFYFDGVMKALAAGWLGRRRWQGSGREMEQDRKSRHKAIGKCHNNYNGYPISLVRGTDGYSHEMIIHIPLSGFMRRSPI